MLLGIALNNFYSVIMAIYGIYLILFFKELNYKKILYLNLFLIFSLILIFSSLISIFQIQSLKTSVPYLLYYFYFVAAIHIINEWKEKNYRFFLISIYITVILLFSYAIVEYFTLLKNDQGELDYLYRNSGLKSLFENKVLGIYLLKIFPLFIGLKLFLKDKFKYFDFILIFMIILMIFLSYHRTSIIILFLFIFMTYIFIHELRKIISIIAALLAFIIFLTQILFVDFSDSVVSKTKNQIFSSSGIKLYPDHYLGHFNTSIKMIKQNLLLGTGPNTFKDLCSDKKYEYIYTEFIGKNSNLVKLNSCSTHTHNYYLQIFSEGGIFSFCLLIFFYFFIFKELVFCYLKKNSLNDNVLYKTCLISTFCSFLPFSPNVDFFNTYLNSLLYLPCIFILYFKLNNKGFFKKN